MRVPSVAGAPKPTALLIGTLALLSAVSPLATDMYLPAVPQITRDLGTSASAVQLTLTAFMIGPAAGQFFIGPLSDSLGADARCHARRAGTPDHQAQIAPPPQPALIVSSPPAAATCAAGSGSSAGPDSTEPSAVENREEWHGQTISVSVNVPTVQP